MLALAALVCALFTFAASPARSGEVTAQLTVGGAGDSVLLLSSLARAFEKEHPGVVVDIQSSIGSGGGIRALIDEKLNFARTTRPLKNDEERKEFVQEVFAVTPVAILTNRQDRSLTGLNSCDLLGIYNGNINNWSELGLPKAKIYPLTRQTGVANLMAMKTAFPTFGEGAKSATLTIYSTPNMIASLVKNDNAIGFAPITEAVGSDLKVLALDGVSPTKENLESGKYPLSFKLFLIYSKELPDSGRKFLDFVFSPKGSEIIRSQGALAVVRDVNRKAR
jgi:phosphate transport system substrate-binding protein